MTCRNLMAKTYHPNVCVTIGPFWQKRWHFWHLWPMRIPVDQIFLNLPPLPCTPVFRQRAQIFEEIRQGSDNSSWEEANKPEIYIKRTQQCTHPIYLYHHLPPTAFCSNGGEAREHSWDTVFLFLHSVQAIIIKSYSMNKQKNDNTILFFILFFHSKDDFFDTPDAMTWCYCQYLPTSRICALYPTPYPGSTLQSFEVYATLMHEWPSWGIGSAQKKEQKEEEKTSNTTLSLFFIRISIPKHKRLSVRVCFSGFFLPFFFLSSPHSPSCCSNITISHPYQPTIIPQNTH